MNFFPEIEATVTRRFTGRSSLVLPTAVSFLWQLPALAEKVEQTMSAPTKPPDNFLLGVFTVLNYVAGIAILAAVVLCVIWFIQKRNEPEVEGEETVVDETKADENSAATSAPEAAKAEEKAEGAKSEEAKADSDEKKSEEKKD